MRLLFVVLLMQPERQGFWLLVSGDLSGLSVYTITISAGANPWPFVFCKTPRNRNYLLDWATGKRGDDIERADGYVVVCRRRRWPERHLKLFHRGLAFNGGSLSPQSLSVFPGESRWGKTCEIVYSISEEQKHGTKFLVRALDSGVGRCELKEEKQVHWKLLRLTLALFYSLIRILCSAIYILLKWIYF